MQLLSAERACADRSGTRPISDSGCIRGAGTYLWVTLLGRRLQQGRGLLDDVLAHVQVGHKVEGRVLFLVDHARST